MQEEKDVRGSLNEELLVSDGEGPKEGSSAEQGT